MEPPAVDTTASTAVASGLVTGGSRMVQIGAVNDKIHLILDETPEVHGHRPGTKQEGVIRVLYENANGIDGKFTNNWKVEKAKELHDELRQTW